MASIETDLSDSFFVHYELPLHLLVMGKTYEKNPVSKKGIIRPKRKNSTSNDLSSLKVVKAEKNSVEDTQILHVVFHEEEEMIRAILNCCGDDEDLAILLKSLEPYQMLMQATRDHQIDFIDQIAKYSWDLIPNSLVTGERGVSKSYITDIDLTGDWKPSSTQSDNTMESDDDNPALESDDDIPALLNLFVPSFLHHQN